MAVVIQTTAASETPVPLGETPLNPIMWTPITLDELTSEIQQSLAELDGQGKRLWELIRITPVKWEEEEYGIEGGGFWVVALLGENVVWYNDIEEGFNLGKYTIYGKIDTYSCDQYKLLHVIRQLLSFLDIGQMPLQRGAPENLKLE